MIDALLAVGTRKGLVLGRRESGHWSFDPIEFALNAVYAVMMDTRHDPARLLVATDNEWSGPALHRSDDLGHSWTELPGRPIAMPESTDATVRRVWQLAPGRWEDPDVVYAGVEPTSLFRSEDGGANFSLVTGLWDHPHRPNWQPGYGGAAIHTVLPHPRDADRVTIAMSAGGVYRTTDGGTNWAPANVGVRVSFMPDEEPEYGQCVHKIAMHPTVPDRMFLQNHGGVYRSDDAGDTWTSIAKGLPADFGFPIVVDPANPSTVFVFPLTADAYRFAPDHLCRVYRSDDAGDTWEAAADGLPAEPFYSIVLRDAMCADVSGIYFGTRTGEVYGSGDGHQWQRLVEHLPDVLCVRALTVG